VIPCSDNSVSTTELAYFQFLVEEFDKRNVKLIALAPGTVEAHKAWSDEIGKLATKKMTIPIIADKSKAISLLYDMIDPDERAKSVANTVRDIFIIDQNKKVRLIFSYPANVGASEQEVIRVIDCLQTPDDVLTPVGWVPGEQVLVKPSAVDTDLVCDIKPIAKNVVLGTLQDTTEG